MIRSNRSAPLAVFDFVCLVAIFQSPRPLDEAVVRSGVLGPHCKVIEMTFRDLLK